MVEAGKCRVCGCTDARACVGGCTWLDEGHTLCSECGVWCDACPELVLLGDPEGRSGEARVGEDHVVIVDRLGEVIAVLHQRCAPPWLEEARLKRERAAAAEAT